MSRKSVEKAPGTSSDNENGISRRRLLASAGALGAGVVLPTIGSSNGSQAAPAAQEAVEITINVHKDKLDEAQTVGKPPEGGFGEWWQVEVYTTHLDKFNAENPNIKATMEWFPGRPQSEKIFALKASGQLADVVDGLGLILDVAARNEIYQPLDELIQNANYDLGQWLPSVIDALRFDPLTGARGAGQPLYALPAKGTPGSQIIFYNVDMFARKGVPVPTSDMSWDSLVETAIAMTERREGADEADVYGMLVSAYWFGEIFTTWLRDFGAEMFDASGTTATLNTPEAKAFFQFVYDAIYTHGFSPRPDLLNAFGQYKAMFLQQKTAMFRLPPFGVLAMSEMPAPGEDGHFEWGSTRTPAGPSGVRGSSLGVEFIGISADSEHPAEAFTVLDWVTNKDASVYECYNAGMCSPRPDVYADERVTKSAFLTLANEAFTTALPPHYAANGRDAEALAALGTEFDKLTNNQVQPSDEFFDNLNKLVQDVLDKSPA